MELVAEITEELSPIRRVLIVCGRWAGAARAGRRVELLPPLQPEKMRVGESVVRAVPSLRRRTTRTMQKA